MVFLTMNSIAISTEAKMLMLIKTPLSRGTMKMPSSNRKDEAKGYWNHEYDTKSKSNLLFKVK